MTRHHRPCWAAVRARREQSPSVLWQVVLRVRTGRGGTRRRRGRQARCSSEGGCGGPGARSSLPSSPQPRERHGRASSSTRRARRCSPPSPARGRDANATLEDVGHASSAPRAGQPHGTAHGGHARWPHGCTRTDGGWREQGAERGPVGRQPWPRKCWASPDCPLRLRTLRISTIGLESWLSRFQTPGYVCLANLMSVFPSGYVRMQAMRVEAQDPDTRPQCR